MHKQFDQNDKLLFSASALMLLNSVQRYRRVQVEHINYRISKEGPLRSKNRQGTEIIAQVLL